MKFEPKLPDFDGSFEVREATRKEVMQLVSMIRCLYRDGGMVSSELAKVQDYVEQISGLGEDEAFLKLPVVHQSFLLEHLAHIYTGGIPGN